MAYEEITVTSDSPLYTLHSYTSGTDHYYVRVSVYAEDVNGSPIAGAPDLVATAFKDALEALPNTSVTNFNKLTTAVTNLL